MDADHSAHGASSKHHHFGGSASVWDPDASHSNSDQPKHKRFRVVPHDVIQKVFIIGESKNKQGMVYDVDRQKEVKGVHSNDHIGSSSSSSYLGVQNNILLNIEAWSDDDEGVEASGQRWQWSKPKRPIDFDSRAQIEDEIDRKFKSFKQFDIVRDYSDHYYAHSPAPHKSAKNWTKAIQREWKVLEKDLPENIFVRIYEARIDLLRAVIIGSAGTPYHDGLFFFDIRFPFDYPLSPPSVNYHSHGLRVNPNLHVGGKVCLSLLNTWEGHGCEKWNPSYSTILQVLVSIQALVLNSKPFFNEPLYSSSANTLHGERRSLAYNKEIFLLSCKTMLYSLRWPLKHFEDFVVGHFRKQGRAILVAYQAYMHGAQVGSDIKGDEVQAVNKDYRCSAATFKTPLQMLFEDLLMAFAAKGADCADFLDQKVKDGAAAATKAPHITVSPFELKFQN